MNDLSLYEITDELAAYDQLLEMEQGEISEDLAELENHVFMLLQTKVDASVGYIEREKDYIELAKNRIKVLQEFVKAKENKIARFEGYIKTCLERTKLPALVGNLHEIKLRKPPTVLVVSDETQVPVEFTKVETIVSVDKVALKKALQNGDIPETEAIRLGPGKVSITYSLIRGKRKKVENE